MTIPTEVLELALKRLPSASIQASCCVIGDAYVSITGDYDGRWKIREAWCTMWNPGGVDTSYWLWHPDTEFADTCPHLLPIRVAMLQAAIEGPEAVAKLRKELDDELLLEGEPNPLKLMR